MANEIIKACIDKPPKQDSSGQPLAAETAKMWQPGTTLRIRFLDGDPSIQEKVFEHAQEWCQYANIVFEVSTDPDAEIRITFKESGSWSLIGTDALHEDMSKPTMNYGWFDQTTPDDEYRRTVVHEFGHALGCEHEQASPAADIHWNKQATYRYYQSTQGWSKEDVDQQVFEKYSTPTTQFTTWDKNSIMQYPIPAGLTTDGVQVGWNMDLTDTDKQFIKSKYPGVEDPNTGT